jgi:hypothetical protein
MPGGGLQCFAVCSKKHTHRVRLASIALKPQAPLPIYEHRGQHSLSSLYEVSLTLPHTAHAAMQAAIIIHYGEGSNITCTRVLGHLDLCRIPPAPKDVPRIEVTFSLSAEHTLKVRVRDMDTQRQKEWLQRGGVVLLKEGIAENGPAVKQSTARAL